MVHGRPWPSLGLKECLSALKESIAWKNRDSAENEGWGLAVGLWPCGVSPASAVCRMLRTECASTVGFCRYFRN